MGTDKLDAEAQLAERVGRLERELAEGLAHEAASGEILREIAGSLSALQPVLDAVVESAARLCEVGVVMRATEAPAMKCRFRSSSHRNASGASSYKGASVPRHRPGS